MSHFLILPILLPLLAAVACLATRHNRHLQHLVAAISVILTLGASLYLLVTLQPDQIMLTKMGNWAVPAGISLIGDGLSLSLVSVSALIVGIAVWYRRSSLREHDRNRLFLPLTFAMLLGVNGAFLTGDLFNLFVFFEVIMMSAFALLALEGKAGQVKASITYVLLNLLASALFLASLGLLYGMAGTLAMADVGLVYAEVLAAGNQAHIDLAIGLMLVAFSIKAGAFPLYAWLPASYHTPSYAVSAMFAGLLTKVGVYALLRFTTVVAPGATWITEILLVVGTLTMVFGVLGAATQKTIREILSYHIISQIGYLIVGLALGGAAAIAAVIFYLVHHIIVKANLFFVGGVVERHGGGNVYKGAGLVAWTSLSIAFLIPALSLAGIPPLSGFVAKFGIVEASFTAERWYVGAAALFTGLFTVYSMTKIWIGAFWSPKGEESVERTFRYPLVRTAPMLALAAITVAIGLSAGPLMGWCQEVGKVVVDPMAYQQAAGLNEATVAGVKP